MVIDWSTIVLGSATAALSTYAVLRMDRKRSDEIRDSGLAKEAAVLASGLARSIADISRLQENLRTVECEVSELRGEFAAYRNRH